MERFPDHLVMAVAKRGSILAVATTLGVEPNAVYRWIAGLDLPSAETRSLYAATLDRHQTPVAR